MSPSNPRPKWWQLYLTFPVLIALFALDGRLKISARGHQAVQIGIILLIYGLIHLWLKANSGALSQMDRTQHSRTIRIVRVPAAESPEAHRERRSILQLSDGEIQGLLTDTMDMRFIDAESSTLDDVRRN
jgi:hypothetical protein